MVLAVKEQKEMISRPGTTDTSVANGKVPGMMTLCKAIWCAMKIYCTPSLHIADVTSDVGTIHEFYLMQLYQNQNRVGFSREECGMFCVQFQRVC